jgi:hypothetical protein
MIEATKIIKVIGHSDEKLPSLAELDKIGRKKLAKS